VVEWLLTSDEGLFWRILLGGLILCAFAVVDLRRNGRAARRWREYLFLTACVGLALAYGLINDQATVGISWEYFYYGKDAMAQLGAVIPPDAWALRWEAAKIGAKATWSAGLILGVILLFANNPTSRLAPLPFARVFARLPVLLGITVACAVTMGVLGGLGALKWLNSDFQMLLAEDLWRPYRFMAVYGAHLGGYIGGLLGTIVVCVLLRRERRVAAQLANAQPDVPLDQSRTKSARI
jgi:hypothetical protein